MGQNTNYSEFRILSHIGGVPHYWYSSVKFTLILTSLLYIVQALTTNIHYTQWLLQCGGMWRWCWIRTQQGSNPQPKDKEPIWLYQKSGVLILYYLFIWPFFLLRHVINLLYKHYNYTYITSEYILCFVQDSHLVRHNKFFDSIENQAFFFLNFSKYFHVK